MDNPVFIPQAFATSGNKNNIENALQPSQNQGAATWQLGFPPVTSIPPSAGGIAPDRLDFNGIFYALSAHAVFTQNGGVFKFSQDIADGNGYEIGAVIMSDDNTKTFVSTKNGNKTNPNIDLDGWKIFNGDSYTKEEADERFLTSDTGIKMFPTVPTTEQGGVIYVEPYGIMKWSNTHNLYQSTAPIFQLGDAQNPPAGLLYADGSKVSISAYQSLYTKCIDNGLIIDLLDWVEGAAFFAVDGDQLKLPDLGGYFQRPWTPSQAADIGRSVFSSQEDAFKQHTHTLSSRITQAGGTVDAAGSWNGLSWGYTQAVGGSETRPCNTAFPIWIHP